MGVTLVGVEQMGMEWSIWCTRDWCDANDINLTGETLMDVKLTDMGVLGVSDGGGGGGDLVVCYKPFMAKVHRC